MPIPIPLDAFEMALPVPIVNELFDEVMVLFEPMTPEFVPELILLFDPPEIKEDFALLDMIFSLPPAIDDNSALASLFIPPDTIEYCEVDVLFIPPTVTEP